MSNASAQVVQKLWSYCNVLRDDGLSYGAYVEQHGPQALASQAIPSDPLLHDVAQFRDFLSARRVELARMMNGHLQRAREASGGLLRPTAASS